MYSGYCPNTYYLTHLISKQVLFLSFYFLEEVKTAKRSYATNRHQPLADGGGQARSGACRCGPGLGRLTAQPHTGSKARTTAEADGHPESGHCLPPASTPAAPAHSFCPPHLPKLRGVLRTR